jgi:amino acid permease
MNNYWIIVAAFFSVWFCLLGTKREFRGKDTLLLLFFSAFVFTVIVISTVRCVDESRERAAEPFGWIGE